MHGQAADDAVGAVGNGINFLRFCGHRKRASPVGAAARKYESYTSPATLARRIGSSDVSSLRAYTSPIARARAHTHVYYTRPSKRVRAPAAVGSLLARWRCATARELKSRPLRDAEAARDQYHTHTQACVRTPRTAHAEAHAHAHAVACALVRP